MARILVMVGSETTATGAVEVLEQAGHEVLSTKMTEELSGRPETWAERIGSQDPDLVLMDLIVEDAWSVKVMQSALDRKSFLKFIFLLDGPIDPPHLTLAFNEGAAAVLSRPINPESLRLYVQRALTRQTAEKTEAQEIERGRQLIDREKSCSAEQAVQISRQKRLLQISYALINRLLIESAALPHKKRSILLVSDSAYQVDLFRQHLEKAGFEVTAAGDSQAGLEAARKDRPKVIVSDLEMPGLTGLELCRAVKNDPGLSAAHFIICTANEDKIEAVLNPENKVDDCLVKPSRPEEFEEFIARTALGLLI